MNVNFVDARGCSPEKITESVAKNFDQPSIVYNVALADLEVITSQLTGLPDATLHSQFSLSF